MGPVSDFSGKTLALRTGCGEKDVEIFVAVLAHSNLTYAEAVPTRPERTSLDHGAPPAFKYFGGVPARWIAATPICRSLLDMNLHTIRNHLHLRCR